MSYRSDKRKRKNRKNYHRKRTGADNVRRGNDTRITDSRSVDFQRALEFAEGQQLPLPPAPPGYKHKWLKYLVLGRVSDSFRRNQLLGWKIVDPNEYSVEERALYGATQNEKGEDVFESGGLVAGRIEEELLIAIEKRYEEKAKKQAEANRETGINKLANPEYENVSPHDGSRMVDSDHDKFPWQSGSRQVQNI